MRIPLEDSYNDVLGKAQRGYQMTDEQLARAASISVAELEKVKSGEFDASIVQKLATLLKLDGGSLIALGKKSWYPNDPGPIEGLACFNTAYEDMTVNSYLVWDPQTGQAACFDTGADSSGMVKFASEKKLKIQMILLTHTHPDHIADLTRLKTVTGAKAFVCELEACDGAEPFAAGKKFTLGKLQIETCQTSGHSRGGITFVVNGLARPITVVGDSLFAGSMGGGAVSYADALRNNCEKILTLAEETVVCPGHGPLTTVGEEKRNNPFFPQLKK